MKSEWIRFLEDSSIESVNYFGTDDIRSDVWEVYKKQRPVTAHILEELFGKANAIDYAMNVSEQFTEAKAVSMVAYTWKPQIGKSSKKKSRISNIVHPNIED